MMTAAKTFDLTVLSSRVPDAEELVKSGRRYERDVA
jgi:hypothetical protein